MTNLKFRFFNKIIQKYVDPEYLFVGNGRVIELGDRQTVRDITDKYTVEQWTGLLDSDNREIYEGDIVGWDDCSKGKYWRVAKVVMTNKMSWGFEIIPNKSINCLPNGMTTIFNFGDFSYCPDTSRGGNVMEVIGNINENPET